MTNLTSIVYIKLNAYIQTHRFVISQHDFSHRTYKYFKMCYVFMNKSKLYKEFKLQPGRHIGSIHSISSLLAMGQNKKEIADKKRKYKAPVWPAAATS